MRLSNNTAKPLPAIHFYWHDIAFELGSLLGGDGARSTSQSLLGLGTSSDEPEKAESDGDFCTLLLSGSFLSFLICRSISQDVSKRSSSVVSWAVSKSDNSLPLSFSASVLLPLALLRTTSGNIRLIASLSEPLGDKLRTPFAALWLSSDSWQFTLRSALDVDRFLLKKNQLPNTLPIISVLSNCYYQLKLLD
jgi:hypothetical protein